jgi:3D (Asp-Asp-Asp) domain-containing protein
MVPDEPAAASAPAEEPAASAPSEETGAKTTVDLTYYWVAVRPLEDPDEVRIVDCDGAFLTDASHAFRAEVNMERTARARLDSGETITFNDVGGCFRRINSKQFPWGVGVSNGSQPYALEPFRSIAVDQNRFTLGKWYYAQELDGVSMPAPAAQRHDGCVRAVDTGSAIRGKHVDFFVGDKSAHDSLASGALAGVKTVTLQESERCAGR